MKNTRNFLSLLSISLLLVFTACNKNDESKIKQDDSSYEINLKSLEPDVTVKGGGDKDHYTKVIVADVLKNPKCKNEPVSGIIEFYYEDEMVFAVDFGNGECDRLATVTWVKNDGSTNSKVVDVWSIFKKPSNGDHHKKCFEIILPVDYLMPDSSIFTVDTKEAWIELKEWYVMNPAYDEKPIMQFPVQIQFKDNTTVTVNSREELRAFKKECGNHHHKLTKVITEELIRSDQCDGEIVSGLIDFYDKDRTWVYSFDFGDGSCDGIVTKCWLNKEKEVECEDINISDCHFSDKK